MDMDLVWLQEFIYYERSTDLYCYSYRYNYRYDTMICCGVEREEIYMGGGLLVYKCHTCGSKMETNKV